MPRIGEENGSLVSNGEDRINPVKMAEQRIEKAHSLSTKKWYIVAISVGTLIIGIGSVGLLGLLQSYGWISLPTSLSHAIGTIGHTPHFWSLWTLTTGAIGIGGGLLGFGAYKLKTLRTEKPVHTTPEPTIAQPKKLSESPSVETNKIDPFSSLLPLIKIMELNGATNCKLPNSPSILKILRFQILLEIEERNLLQYSQDEVVQVVQHVIKCMKENIGTGCVFRFELSVSSQESKDQAKSWLNLMCEIFDKCKEIINISGDYTVEKGKNGTFGITDGTRDNAEQRNYQIKDRIRDIAKKTDVNWNDDIAQQKFAKAKSNAPFVSRIESSVCSVGETTFTDRQYRLFKDLNFETES